jgi:hypothetical protein
MDFKSLLNKLDSMEAPAATPQSPTLPAAVQLNEAASLRVLSGRSTVIAEAAKMKKEEEDAKAKAKSKKEEKVDEAEMKTGEKKKSSTGGTIEKTATGVKHTAGKNYSGKAAEKEDKKKTDESTEYAAFKSKFMQMVEAKKEEAEMKTGDKKKSSTGGTIEKTKTGVKHTAGKNYSGKAAEKEVKESKKPDDDNDGVPDWADKKPGKDDNEGKKKSTNKGMSDKQAKYFGKKNESVSTDVKKKAKKVVAESVETKLSFRDMMKLVVESGGQQQIDPLDQELFAWATRVAKSKIGEGMRADVYAGMVYERMGGSFEMYDVLSEGSEGDYLRPGGDVKMSPQDQDNDQARQEKAMIAKFKASGQPVKPGSQIHALMKKHNEL